MDLWDELSSALVESQGSGHALPSGDDLKTRGGGAMVRLALLADFYRYLVEDLELNREELAEKLFAVRAKASEILASEGAGVRPVPSDHSSNESDSPASVARPRGGSAPKLGPRGARVHGSAKRRKVRIEETTKDNDENGSPEKRPRYRGEDRVRWSKLCFSTLGKSYYTKLVKAFHVVKNTGYPMLTLGSEWGLSCYYKLAVAYTTDQPLELSAGCLPELRRAVDIIHSEHFQKLRELKPECQVLLYAVLNCHINWVDRNHKQILLVPGQPSASSSSAPVELDLRCSQCLKNQTFRSSEVKGNPRNIDVEFDFEQMKFGSSCCAAPMIHVPLSTRDVNTCTFTEMKQMYTCCVKCKQPIFSEVLVDMETLYLRCVACAGL